MSVGGITPSSGLVEQCVALGGIDVMMMIRPHEGGFCYDAADVQTMIRDIHRRSNLGFGESPSVFSAVTGKSIVNCADDSATRRVRSRSRFTVPLT